MPRIPVQTVETAPKQGRPTLERVARHAGKPLSIHREMAHAAANVGNVSDSDVSWHAMKQAAWRDVELSEAFAHLFTNFSNHYARTDVCVPAAPALTT